MKNLTTLFITLFLVGNLFAQRDQTVFNSFDINITGMWGGWTTGITNFDGQSTHLTGGFFGVEFNKEALVGIQRQLIDLPNIDGQRSELAYSGLLLGYTPKAYRAIHPNAKLLVGGGNLRLSREDNDQVWVVQPSIGAELNVFRWCRLGADLGYRFVNDSNTIGVSNDDLSAIYGSINLKFGLSWGS